MAYLEEGLFGCEIVYCLSIVKSQSKLYIEGYRSQCDQARIADLLTEV